MSHWWEEGLVDEYNSSIPYTGNIDLDKRKVLRENGVYKTENSITIGVDGKQVIIPTVVDGVQLEEEAAIDHFYETGEQLGAYDTIAEAEKAAQNIHLRQQTKYGSDLPVAGKGSPFVKGVKEAEAEIALAKKASQDPYTRDLVPDIGDLNITDVNTTSFDVNGSVIPSYYKGDANINIKLNNPGALKYNANNKWEGRSGKVGAFEKFATPQYGIRAMAKVLNTKINKRGLNTINKYLKDYTPEKDHPGAKSNNQSNYINHIVKYTGIPADQNLTTKDIAKLVKAQLKFEGDNKNYYTDAIIDEGIRMAGF